jgi:hypothetical protein
MVAGFESCAQSLRQSLPVNADLTFFVKIPLGSDQERGILQPTIFFFWLSDAAAPEIRGVLGMIILDAHKLLTWRIGFHRAFKDIAFQPALFRPATRTPWMAPDFQRAAVKVK